MKTKYLTFALVLLFTILFYSFQPTNACLNEKFFIGSDGTFEQNTIAKMFEIFSGERIGINPVINTYKNYDECFEALKNNKLDVMIVYIPDSANYQNNYNNIKTQYENDYDFTLFPAYANIIKDGKSVKLVPAVNRKFLRDRRTVPELFTYFTYEKVNTFLAELRNTKLDKINSVIYDFLTKENLI